MPSCPILTRRRSRLGAAPAGALEDDFEAQLKRFGFRRDGRHTDEGKLALPANILPVRRKLAALMERDTAGKARPSAASTRSSASLPTRCLTALWV